MLADNTLADPVNADAPSLVRNADYAAVLARVLRRPPQIPVPSLGPRLLLGAEGASEIAEADQWAATSEVSGRAGEAGGWAAA